MEIKDIITLANAGYNAQQISAIMSAQSAPTPPTPPVATAPAPVATPQTPIVPTQPMAIPNQPIYPQYYQQPTAPAQVTPTTSTDPIMEQIKALTTAVQSTALNMTQMPKPETADDVLASIINPPSKEVK